MANRRDSWSLIAIAGFALITAGAGLFLGFVAPRAVPQGKPVPHVPDQGPIVYELRSIFSPPNRVHLEWREVPGALGYRVTIMTADDESLFVSPDLSQAAWTIPPALAAKLASQSVYHWKLTVSFLGHAETSEPSSFATQ